MKGKVNPRALYENRGTSFCAGGDFGKMTVSNLIKQYSPTLAGQSMSDRLVTFCSPSRCVPPILRYRKNDYLNAALSGATGHILDIQVDRILEQLKALNIDMKNDWKMMSLFIGSNEQCDLSCKSTYNWDDYEVQLSHALERLRQNVPKLLVNIVEMGMISPAYLLAPMEKCKNVNFLMKYLCPCAFKGEESRKLMDLNAAHFNAALHRIKSKFAGDDDFAIMLDPSFSEQPIEDINLVSDVDCFHPSALAHSKLAVSIWNNMFVGYSSRKRRLTEDKVLSHGERPNSS